MIRVLIADDQMVIRNGFRTFLEPVPDVTVVGEASSGAEAVAEARALAADVVLMDVRMPHGDGLAATRELTRAAPRRVAVIVVTAFDTDEYIFEALDAGAVGFLLKDTRPTELAEAIRLAASGEAMVTPIVTRRVLQEFQRRKATGTLASSPRETAAQDAGLTARELEIIRALATGMSNAEIGRALHLVPGTVKAHLTQINTKLGTRDRVQTVVWAFTHGLATTTDRGPQGAGA